MTRLQNLNAYLTERLMVAAREILEVVGNTISEYQKETARTIKENEELRRRLREIGVQANLEFLDSGHPVAPPVSIGTTPQGQQPHERQCNSGQGEDREPQQTDIKQEFPEQHESNPEQGVVDLNKQASALTCAENPSEHRILQTSLPFEEKTEEVGCLPHMLPDQIKSEPDELDYSIQKQSIASQPLNRVNNNSSTAESTNCAERNWMDHGGVMPEPNEQDSSREVCDIPVVGGSQHVLCTSLIAMMEERPVFASNAAQLDFKASVAHALINAGSIEMHKRERTRATPAALKRRIVSKVPPELRFGPGNHWPRLTEAKNANRCHDRACRRKTKYVCMQCLVALCPGCFANFHKR